VGEVDLLSIKSSLRATALNFAERQVSSLWTEETEDIILTTQLTYVWFTLKTLQIAENRNKVA
jgi:hypothetical protein